MVLGRLEVFAGLDLLLEPGGTLLEDLHELFGHGLEKLLGDGPLKVLVPHLLVGGDGQLGLGPLAGNVDAETGHHRGRVSQTHGRQMQAANQGHIRQPSQPMPPPLCIQHSQGHVSTACSKHTRHVLVETSLTLGVGFKL